VPHYLSDLRHYLPYNGNRYGPDAYYCRCCCGVKAKKTVLIFLRKKTFGAVTMNHRAMLCLWRTPWAAWRVGVAGREYFQAAAACIRLGMPVAWKMGAICWLADTAVPECVSHFYQHISSLHVLEEVAFGGDANIL